MLCFLKINCERLNRFEIIFFIHISDNPTRMLKLFLKKIIRYHWYRIK